jgi:hypothetical protein
MPKCLTVNVQSVAPRPTTVAAIGASSRPNPRKRRRVVKSAGAFAPSDSVGRRISSSLDSLPMAFSMLATHRKHYGCPGPLVIDARLKPHMATPLVEDPAATKRVDDDLSARGEAPRRHYSSIQILTTYTSKN